MFKRIGMAAAFVAVSAPAYACVCPLLKSDAETQEYKRNYANRSVRLKLTSFQLRMAPNADPRAEAMAEVVEQPKMGARYPSRVVVESDGGDETANCGKASLLFIAASTQRWIRAQITKSRGGHYEIGGCSPMDIEPWRGAAASPSPHN